MPETLVVHLGREDPRSVDVPRSFEAHGTFEVELVNHGVDTHVHLRLDDSLSDVAAVDGDNPYVAADSTERVRIHVAPEDREVRGTLTVATGYGAQEGQVQIQLVAPVSDTVEVDDDLSKPQTPPPESSVVDDALAGLSAVPVALLSLLALLLAFGAFVLTDGNVVVGIASFVVLGAVLLAVYASAS